MVGATSGRGRHRRQRNEPDAIRVRLDQFGGDVQRQTGLTGAARSGQREQADTRLFEPIADLCRELARDR